MTLQCFLPFHRLPPHFVHLTIAMGCLLFLISVHLCLLCLLPSTHQAKLVFLPSLASYTPDLGPFPVQKEELMPSQPSQSSSSPQGGGGEGGEIPAAEHNPHKSTQLPWQGLSHLMSPLVLAAWHSSHLAPSGAHTCEMGECWHSGLVDSQRHRWGSEIAALLLWSLKPLKLS